jgi:hypothetical protein
MYKYYSAKRVLPGEIKPGLCLFLDPDRLLAEGATYSCPDDVRVQGAHYFVCISKDDGGGTWIPLFSNDGPGREALNNFDKSGHWNWTDSPSHYHRGQCWTVPHAAVINAATAAGDNSRQGARNTLAIDAIPEL